MNKQPKQHRSLGRMADVTLNSIQKMLTSKKAPAGFSNVLIREDGTSNVISEVQMQEIIDMEVQAFVEWFGSELTEESIAGLKRVILTIVKNYTLENRKHADGRHN